MQCEYKKQRKFWKARIQNVILEKRQKYNSDESIELDSSWGALQKYWASVHTQDYFNKIP